MMEELRYPIGKFQSKDHYNPEEISQFIGKIEELPAKLRLAIIELNDEQLNTPYREGGWTVRQVVHHLADSHLNAYIRTKWMLTENTPLIKAYEEKLWAVTPETKASPFVSLELISALHAKWIILLKEIIKTDLSRQFIHPETKRHVRLDQLMALYAWHGEHHLSHILSLKKRLGWK